MKDIKASPPQGVASFDAVYDLWEPSESELL